MKVRIVHTFINRVQRPIPKNFGIKIEGEEILVPTELTRWLGGTGNVQTPECLVSVIHSFPSCLIEFCQSSLAEVEQIKLGFFKELEGKVSNDYLYPPPPPERIYDALCPPELSWQIGKTAGSIVFVDEVERCVSLFDDIERAKEIQSGKLNLSIADFFSEIGVEDLDSRMIPGLSRKEQEKRLLLLFILESEIYLKVKVPSINELTVEILRDAIGKVKRGKLVITEPDTTPERYLSLQIHFRQQFSVS